MINQEKQRYIEAIIWRTNVEIMKIIFEKYQIKYGCQQDKLNEI